VTLNDVVMGPHSFYFCVDGGLDDDVANALFYTVVNGLNPAKNQVYYIAYSNNNLFFLI
jgi:hypothetical protein